MNIWAIGDLHMNQSGNKTMDMFGDIWCNHTAKLQDNWEAMVAKEDIVLLPGDISWAINLEEARADMAYLMKLPGKKILLRGNHDYWWDSISKLATHFPALTFLQNDSVFVGGRWICGARGWLCPTDSKFTKDDQKIYNRELIRLKLSLDHACRQGADNILVMFHFPPANSQKLPTGFVDILREYPVTQVVYGHLHGKEAFLAGIQGEIEGINYHLVSADYLEFVPKLIVKE